MIILDMTSEYHKISHKLHKYGNPSIRELKFDESQKQFLFISDVHTYIREIKTK